MLLGVLHDEGEENKRFEMFIKNETKRGTCESCDELLTATAAPCCFGCSFLTPDKRRGEGRMTNWRSTHKWQSL
jgi:hypothetical protein